MEKPNQIKIFQIGFAGTNLKESTSYFLKRRCRNRLNSTILEILDNATSHLHELLKDKDDGVGVIRINESGNSVVEYYPSLDSLKNSVDMSRNLSVVFVRDNIPRTVIRRACLMRLRIMAEQKNGVVPK